MNIEPIHHLSLIKISGEDAETFLQGQLTSDVAKLSNSWQYSGYCTPKGRLLALLQIWRDEEGFYALIACDLLDATIKRLRMYVMRSKVSIQALDNYELIGVLKRDSLAQNLDVNLAGGASEKIALSKYQHGDLIQAEQFCALVINDRALIVHKTNAESVTKPESATKDSFATNSLWQQADIKEGLPQISTATVEQFIPQMLNLDSLGGISFKKGCYTGQEIVARMHYLGKLKQRMFSCDISERSNTTSINKTITTPAVGDKVYSNSTPEKVIGTLVSVDPANHRALAVLRLDSLEIPLQINANYQLKLTEQQPYDLPD